MKLKFVRNQVGNQVYNQVSVQVYNQQVTVVLTFFNNHHIS